MKIAFNRTVVSFWAMGALNNMPYVIMLSAAKSISEGGTAIVFLANVMPGLVVKLSGPYWFDKVSYRTRMKMASILMTSSFLLVSFFSENTSESAKDLHLDKVEDDPVSGNRATSTRGALGIHVIMQLFGVALCSMQGSLGEASLLALCGKVDSIMNQTQAQTNHDIYENEQEDSTDYGDNGANQNTITNAGEESHDRKGGKSFCITAFSSGTGLAGVLGFAFNYVCTKALGMSLSEMLIVALTFPILYWNVFNFSAEKYLTEEDEETNVVEESNLDESTALSSVPIQNHTSSDQEQNRSSNDGNDEFWENPDSHAALSIGESSSTSYDMEIDDDDDSRNNSAGTASTIPILSIGKLDAIERFRLTLSLWPYMIPLFVVYATEYALQSGVWTSIGFPVDDRSARNSFYVAANWTYQAGVFVSRSSGALFTAPMWVVWLMPCLQTLNLFFFSIVATTHFWYDNSLLYVCFYVGLLGGGVYVHSYTRINQDLPPYMREFALSTTSLADTLGIVMADISGLFIQSCLYRANNLDGALVTCPLERM